MRRSRPALAAIALAVVLLVPGAPLPVGGQAPDPSPAASPAIEDLLAEALDEGLVGSTKPEAISEAGRELAALDRERLAVIDPGLPAALEELEARTEEELAAWLVTILPSPEPDASPGPSPLAEASPEPDGSPEPGGRAGHAFLAAVGPRLPDPDRVLDQGGSYLSAVGQVAGMVAGYISRTKPDKLSESEPSSPFARGDTHFEIRNARVRDTVTLGITISETYSVPSSTPGQPAIVVTDRGEATVIVDVCPDEDGTVVATATTSATVDAAGNGLAYRVVADADDRALATVDGQAEVASVAHSGSMSRHATGDREVFSAGGEGDAESHLVGSGEWTSDGTGTATSPTSIDVVTAEGGNDADIRAWALTRALAGALTDGAIAAAAQVWRGGRCLELVPDPAGRTVDPGSETEITVKIEHKAYDEEVERPIRATFAGVERVDPLETPVDAAADFTYTAANEPQTDGTITWRTVSNRGIAERSETYRVEASYRLDVDWTVTFRQAGVTARGTGRARPLRVTPVPGNPDTGEPPGVIVQGDFEFRGRARTPGCSGGYRDSFAVDPAKDASAKIVGEGESRRLVVALRLADPSATITARVSCDGRTVSFGIPMGGMVPSRTVELPLAGGTVSARGNESGARWTATFTLTVERGR